MALDAATRRRLVFETAAYYEHLLNVFDGLATPAESLNDRVMPWAGQRQQLANRAARAGKMFDLGQILRALGEFDELWEEIQRIQAAFALILLAGPSAVGADMDETLQIVSEDVDAMVQAWAIAAQS